MSRRRDVAGQVFGNLTAQTFAGQDTQGKGTWHCVCSCGGTKVVRLQDLLSGRTSSCGCKWKGRTPRPPRPQGEPRQSIRHHKAKHWDESLRGLMVAVEESTGVKRSELAGDSRHNRVVNARRLVFLVLRLKDKSYPEIGKLCGGYNRSTVLGSVGQATVEEWEQAEELSDAWGNEKALTAEDLRREELFAANCAKWADMWRSDQRFKIEKIEDEL